MAWSIGQGCAAKADSVGTVAGDAIGLLPLIEMLEPVKWYGTTAGQGEAGNRRCRTAYDADTPLDRVVDFIPPRVLRPACGEYVRCTSPAERRRGMAESA